MSVKKWRSPSWQPSASRFCEKSPSTLGNRDLRLSPFCWFLLDSRPHHLQILLWWLPDSFRNRLRISGLKNVALPIPPTNSICPTERFSFTDKKEDLDSKCLDSNFCSTLAARSCSRSCISLCFTALDYKLHQSCLPHRFVVIMESCNVHKTKAKIRTVALTY